VRDDVLKRIVTNGTAFTGYVNKLPEKTTVELAKLFQKSLTVTPPADLDLVAAEQLLRQASPEERMPVGYFIARYAFSRTLTTNTSDAEDITQDTLLHALQNLGTYKPNGQFKSWLFRIATNLYIDQKRPRRSKDIITSDVAKYGSIGGDPETTAHQREIVQALYEAIGDLLHAHKLIVNLHCIEQMDYSQIAKRLSIKESTVRWHMYEARRILRKKLGWRFDLDLLQSNQIEND